MSLLALNNDMSPEYHLTAALPARLIADWSPGCKRGPLIPVPLPLVRPLPFLKSAWPILGSLAACGLDSDG